MSKRDEYVENLKVQIDELNTDLDQLDAKVRKASADAKIKYEGQIKDFRQKRDEIRQKLSEIQGAGEDALEELKKGAESAWNSLKESFSKAKSEFEHGYKEGSND